MRKGHYKVVLDVLVYSDDDVSVSDLLYLSEIDIVVPGTNADVNDVVIESVECKDSR